MSFVPLLILSTVTTICNLLHKPLLKNKVLHESNTFCLPSGCSCLIQHSSETAANILNTSLRAIRRKNDHLHQPFFWGRRVGRCYFFQKINIWYKHWISFIVFLYRCSATGSGLWRFCFCWFFSNYLIWRFLWHFLLLLILSTVITICNLLHRPLRVRTQWWGQFRRSSFKFLQQVCFPGGCLLQQNSETSTAEKLLKINTIQNQTMMQQRQRTTHYEHDMCQGSFAWRPTLARRGINYR